MIKIGIIQFPGANCERETMLAVQRVGMEAETFLWNEPVQKLIAMDGYIIVGGFSYEDRSRAGIIAALHPLMNTLKEQSLLMKPILGICNGAQILVESGLVPGLVNNQLGMALTANKRVSAGKILGTGFYNAWVNIRLSDEYQRNAFTRDLTIKDILTIPVAHGEGRFVMSAGLLQEIKIQGLNVFQYCNAEGKIDSDFPTNPNGSMDNIAAIANKAGNVLAMMPHPERTEVGDVIFKSMRQYILSSQKREKNILPLNYTPRKMLRYEGELPQYRLPTKNHEMIVELMITDNAALTVQQTLAQLGIVVKVKCLKHWEINCSEVALNKIKESDILFNTRKEFLTERQNHYAYFLVRPKDDFLAQSRLQMLVDHFAVNEVHSLKYAILWQFEVDTVNISGLTQTLLQTNLIHNPYAHDCYQYHTVSRTN